MLTAVSRPAWTLLQKYLPGKSHTCASEAEKSSIDFGQKLMAGLDNLMPGDQSPTHLHVAYVHCQHEQGGVFTSGDVEALSWLTADSLRELGIQEDASMNLKVQRTAPMEYRYLTTTRNFLSRFLAPKEAKQTDSILVGYPSPTVRTTNTWWWQGLWSSDPHQNTLYETKTSADAETQSPHCIDHHSSGHCEVNCQRSPDDQVELLGHNNHVEWTCSEYAGPSHYNESADQTSLRTAKLEFLLNSDCSPSAHEHSSVEHQVHTRAAAACSEVAVLTPDQDNGYSSFEEESAGAGQCNMNTVCELLDFESSAASPAGDHGHGGEKDKAAGNAQCEKVEKKVEDKEDEKVQKTEPVIVHEALPLQSTPRCLNKTIAYIMGSPCSDESDTEDGIPDRDDDDGFDSDDLDSCSDSEDLEDSDDEEDSESDELDSESERLWTSLCQTRDPYNPHNFTAPIRTSQKLSESAVNSCTAGSTVEPESLLCSSPLSPPSPLEGPQKDMESSEETCSSMDEAESLRLWDSFSCSSDPYSPLNFRAAIRTRQPARRRCRKEPPVEPLVYSKEEAEERMDSGFSEAAIGQGVGSAGVVKLKKVTFMEEVEEFYASSDEERRGPWEEYARDRCRFQRRVQEVETSISYCLSPSFRLEVFQRHYSSS
ncbi:Protein phosphatase 1 regulatory subunit 15B [Bagarius yarrelli]|uniref:Protein phosphatase 1 regulatory subunit 15B n=1 Tax=Bagarius yarrelli TaxID=175774 RepID=A0A556V4A6_BAGYA|nr:Protein phosphatase 1 regulatory subunit 15B [Bagarius yarrelli]